MTHILKNGNPLCGIASFPERLPANDGWVTVKRANKSVASMDICPQCRRRMLVSKYTRYTIAAVAVVVLTLGISSPASAWSLWDFIVEMCAVRHPLGHASLFNWSGTAGVTTSVIEWGTISAVGLTLYSIRQYIKG